MVNEMVGVCPLCSFAERREEFVRAAVNRTADEVEHDVRASSIAMVDELHAKVMRWLQPSRRHHRPHQPRTTRTSVLSTVPHRHAPVCYQDLPVPRSPRRTAVTTQARAGQGAATATSSRRCGLDAQRLLPGVNPPQRLTLRDAGMLSKVHPAKPRRRRTRAARAARKAGCWASARTEPL